MLVKLNGIEHRRSKPKAVGSSPIARSIAGLAQRKNACLTSKLRGFDSCTRYHFFHPGIAQLVERAIDNLEAVGSTPTPWTNFERASPSTSSERGTTCTFRASDEWRAGPSLGSRAVPGKSDSADPVL